MANTPGIRNKSAADEPIQRASAATLDESASPASDVSLDPKEAMEPGMGSSGRYMAYPERGLGPTSVEALRASKKLDFELIARSIGDRAFEVEPKLLEILIHREQVHGIAEVVFKIDSEAYRDPYGRMFPVYLDSYRKKSPQGFPSDDLELVAEDAMTQVEENWPEDSERDEPEIRLRRPGIDPDQRL